MLFVVEVHTCRLWTNEHTRAESVMSGSGFRSENHWGGSGSVFNGFVSFWPPGTVSRPWGESGSRSQDLTKNPWKITIVLMKRNKILFISDTWIRIRFSCCGSMNHDPNPDLYQGDMNPVIHITAKINAIRISVNIMKLTSMIKSCKIVIFFCQIYLLTYKTLMTHTVGFYYFLFFILLSDVQSKQS